MNSLNPSEAVRLLAEISGPGRYVCPQCSGGANGERSLSVQWDLTGRPTWRCFRASCGFSGGAGGVSGSRRKEPRYFTRPIVPLLEHHKAIIETRFGTRELADEIDGYSIEDDRFVLPVYAAWGYKRRGCVAYSLSGVTPKSLNYNEYPNEPFIHWAGDNSATDIVVVEDWFSAEKVALTGKTKAVSLQGTLINQPIVDELTGIASALGSRVWLALDRDAFPKAIHYLSKYREQFPLGLYAWSLDRDLKYESVERIKRALSGDNNFLGDECSGGNDEGQDGV